MNMQKPEYRRPAFAEIKVGDMIHGFHSKEEQPFMSRTVSKIEDDKIWTEEEIRPILRSSIEEGNDFLIDDKNVGWIIYKVLRT